METSMSGGEGAGSRGREFGPNVETAVAAKLGGALAPRFLLPASPVDHSQAGPQSHLASPVCVAHYLFQRMDPYVRDR